jgi:hypothetical protein
MLDPGTEHGGLAATETAVAPELVVMLADLRVLGYVAYYFFPSNHSLY